MSGRTADEQLTTARVLAITADLRDTADSARVIATRHGVGMSTVHHIRSGENWARITGGRVTRTLPPNGGRVRRLTPSNVRDIVDSLTNRRKSFASLAVRHGVSETTIQNIAAGRTWAHITGGPVQRPHRKESLPIEQAERAICLLLRGKGPTAVGRAIGVSAYKVSAIADGRSYADLTGGGVDWRSFRPHKEGAFRPDGTRSEWVGNVALAIKRLRADPSDVTASTKIALSIDEVHVPPVAARMMGMTVVDWLAAVRVDQSDGGTHRREPLTAPQLVRALEIARAILANGGRLVECAMPEIGAIALSRPADGTPV